MRYTHLSPEYKKSAIDVLEAASIYSEGKAQKHAQLLPYNPHIKTSGFRKKIWSTANDCYEEV